MAFPAGPYTDGQTHTEFGVSYTYSTATGGFIKTSVASGVGVDSTRTVTGVMSVTGGGDLSADRTLHLVNDNATPAANTYYGTFNNSTRGFQSNNNFFFNNSTTYVPPGRMLNTVNSITGGGDLSTAGPITLVGDVASPGANMNYGSGVGNAKGWYPRDLTVPVGSVPLTRTLGSSSSITNFSTAGGTEALTKNLTPRLTNDVASPGANYYYGTNSSGTRGWYISRIPGWQRAFSNTTFTLGGGVTANGRLANGGGTGAYNFNSTATQLIPNRVNRVRFTVKAAESNRFLVAWVGSLSAVLTGGNTDANGFYTGSIVVRPTAAWPVSIRNGGTLSATIEWCEFVFMLVE